jgi:AhpD family alkylhydroperoxidase
VVAELLRLQVAESTGCTLCRNMRKRDAVEAGVDEDRVTAMRDGRFDEFEQDTHAALELGRRFCTDPESAPGVDADFAARGASAVATEVLTLMKATAFGKVVVMLGVEPEDTSVRVVA